MGEFPVKGKTVEAQIANEDRVFAQWDRWANGREVNPWGCCNVHKVTARHISSEKDLKLLFGGVTSDSTTYVMKVLFPRTAVVAKRMLRRTRAKK